MLLYYHESVMVLQYTQSLMLLHYCEGVRCIMDGSGDGNVVSSDGEVEFDGVMDGDGDGEGGACSDMSERLVRVTVAIEINDIVWFWWWLLWWWLWW
ncbi:hypothetical protein Lalb_Chr08g0233021 [Lupinus albus]|uniref:Uncharacterized protein n=1 Tax=Lupinus albus TaxID=3870 RepID=A0A6A4Q3N4_LUPAL|nr:hypothetical protein Lalb_Chr08g0233021 [Lupinus albus]